MQVDGLPEEMWKSMVMRSKKRMEWDQYGVTRSSACLQTQSPRYSPVAGTTALVSTPQTAQTILPPVPNLP